MDLDVKEVLESMAKFTGVEVGQITNFVGLVMIEDESGPALRTVSNIHPDDVPEFLIYFAESIGDEKSEILFGPEV